MKRTNRPTSSSNSRPSASQAQSESSVLRLQKGILTLAGLLIIAWIIVAGVFVISAQSPSQGQSPVTQSTQGVEEEPAPITATPVKESSNASPLPAACVQTAQVVSEGSARITENGTIEIVIEGQIYPVKLAGLKLSPQESTGETLAKTIRELLDGQPVTLVQEIGGADETGSLTGYLFAGDTFVNLELIRRGLASADLESSQRACTGYFQQAELAARDEKVGMWQPARVPTSTFVPLVTLDPSGQPNCDCSQQYECADFSTHTEAQACYNACNDYDSKLDLDRNGIACEELP